MKQDREGLDDRLEQFRLACRREGMKITHQRLEIFREMATSTVHPDAETVYRNVRRRVSTVSLDTVYRTLWFLNDLGLVKTLGPRREAVRFDGKVKPHHHFICVKCGTVTDFESSDLDTLSLPEKVNGFGSILGSQVEVKGLCRKCGGKTGRTRRCRGRTGG